MQEPVGQPGVLNDYASALHSKASAVRDFRQNLTNLRSSLDQVMDPDWQRALGAWIDRTAGELAKVASHFDAASTVYRHLAESVRTTNSQLTRAGTIEQLAANTALDPWHTELFDATTIVRNQAAGELQRLANEAPQIQAAQAIQPKVSPDSMTAGIAGAAAVLLGLGLFALTKKPNPALSEFLGIESESAVPIAERELTAAEAEQAAWERYLVRKAAEGIDPLTREQWTARYQTLAVNRAAGTTFEKAVFDSLGTSPSGEGWVDHFRINGLRGGARILDIADKDAKIGYEAKSGNAINGTDILGQLLKDEQLLKSDWVITWVSESNPTGSVLEQITRMQLQYPNFTLIVVGR